MAIDTEEKRRSALLHIIPFMPPWPTADSSIDAGDRADVLGFYSGLFGSGDLTETCDTATMSFAGVAVSSPQSVVTADTELYMGGRVSKTQNLPPAKRQSANTLYDYMGLSRRGRRR
jgi:hypothetical protein